jgi:hypothetical protein
MTLRMITRVASTPIPGPVRSANKAIAAAETLRACGKNQAAKGSSGDLRSAVVSFEQAGNEFRNAGSLFRAVSDDAQCHAAYKNAADCYRDAAKAASKTTMTHSVAYLLGLACQAEARASGPANKAFAK